MHGDRLLGDFDIYLKKLIENPKKVKAGQYWNSLALPQSWL